MNELVVPDPFAGPDVEADDALGEEVVARPVAAVPVVGGDLGRQVEVAQLLVDRELRPDAGVAGVAPRLVFPGLDPEVVSLRHDVEDPEPLAGPRVVSADVAWRGRVSGFDGRDDLGHHHVVRNDGARHAPHLRAGAVDVLRQIHVAAVAESVQRDPRLRIERDEPPVAHVVEDPLLIAVGPPGHPAAGALWPTCRIVFGTRPRRRREEPDRLPGGGIDGGHLAGPGRRIEHAAHHERRRLEVEERPRIGVLGPPAPGHLEIVDVAGVDLIQRGVLGVPAVARVEPPFARRRPRIARRRDRPRRESRQARPQVTACRVVNVTACPVVRR